MTIVQKFEKKDLKQVLELCREVRQHHIDLLNGYFTKQNDDCKQIGFLTSLKGRTFGNFWYIYGQSNKNQCKKFTT